MKKSFTKASREKWLKYRAYLHLTNKISLRGVTEKLTEKAKNNLKKKVCNSQYVANHAFFPLLHYAAIQRRYKKQWDTNTRDYIRSHTKLGENKSTAKVRHIHYATHIDAHIYAYYKQLLSKEYEKELKSTEKLDKAVLAYRHIPQTDKNGKIIRKPNGNSVGKNSIHFAKEIFDEISQYTQQLRSCVVFAFDIKDFFPTLNHKKIKKDWTEIMCFANNKLPDDHYNVFKSVTKYAYIDLKELKTGRGFDEKKLHQIREEGGNAFLKSAEEFRKAIKKGEFRIRKNQYSYQKQPHGIPQGLPISSVLANIYMLDFDNAILNKLGNEGIYRRYSYDILIVCSEKDADNIEKFVADKIEEQKLNLATDKTEKFIFSLDNQVVKVKKWDKNKKTYLPNIPLTYLGFEFYGHKTLLKAANISKFYRRIKQSLNAKKRVLQKLREKHNNENIPLYTKDFRKLLSSQKPQNTGQTSKKNDKYGNFPYYVRKAQIIFGGDDMMKQIRNRYKFYRKEVIKLDL